MGRNWVCLADGSSFVASDLVGSSSGSVTYNYRDAVLNVTENDFLAGGGVFRIPGSGTQINAMRFTATLDKSIGQGPLQIGTNYDIFTCNAPVDRLAWQDMETPIIAQSLIAYGAEGYYSTIVTNGDLIFRSIDGVRSLIQGRRDFATRRGNTPISAELARVIDADNRALLQYGSAIVFDNRMLMTANPQQSSGGVYHDKLVVMNLDPSSNLIGASPDIWEGEWNDLNVLQLVMGRFAGLQRAFAFNHDADTGKIGLSELLITGAQTKDNGTRAIPLEAELPPMFVQPNPAKRQMLQLDNGELILDEIEAGTTVSVSYRPDYSSDFVLWKTTTFSGVPSFNPRIGLGKPDVSTADSTGRPHRCGYHFQLKLNITGSCSVKGVNLFATTLPQSKYAAPS